MPNTPYKRAIIRPRTDIGTRERTDAESVGIVQGRRFEGLVDSPPNVPHQKVIAPEPQQEREQPLTHLVPISAVPTHRTDNYGREIGNITAGSRAPTDGNWPLTTIAGQSTRLKWAFRVRHIIVQNNSGANVWIDFDASASQGSLLLPDQSFFDADVTLQMLDVWTAAAIPINGAGTYIYVVGFQ